MYIQGSLKNYLDDLAARLPAPGGGSAAALTGALGAALISMVCNFTIGKEKYKNSEEQIKDILSQSQRSRLRFMELLDLDVQAYQSKDLEKSLEVPLEVCRIAHHLSKACPELVNIGNVNLISDVGCAYDCLWAAFISARRNVDINLKNMGDITRKEGINYELDKLEEEIKQLKIKVEENVGKVIRRQDYSI